MKSEIKNKQRIRFELIAIITTIIGKFVFMDWLDWRFFYVVTASLFWLIYLIKTKKQNPDLFEYWGFRKDNFKKVLFMLLPFGVFAIITFFITGYFLETLNINWHLIPILLTYPIWGTIQQFLLIALLLGNLNDLINSKDKKWQIIVLSSILFSAVHFPEYWLMLGTFILALLYGYIYLKEKNLYVLGLFHGWLGGLYYYTVVGRDPFLETFGDILPNLIN